MPSSLQLSLPTLMGFLLVLARIGGAVAFVPIPGLRNVPAMAKVFLVFTITLALFPQWPSPDTTGPLAGKIVVWMPHETVIGLTIGLVVTFVSEGILLSFQLLGLQAGYTYASTIDPTTDADSSVLQIIGQLASGLLFFSLNLHQDVFRAFVYSLQTHPAGSVMKGGEWAIRVTGMASNIFATGIQLAMPVMATMMLVDVSLALMGRLNSQLQLIQLAFPAKMLIALGLLGWIMLALVRVYQRTLIDALRSLHTLLGT